MLLRAGNMNSSKKIDPVFSTIYMDPNWNERGGGKIKRGADRHYETATLKQIYQTI